MLLDNDEARYVIERGAKAGSLLDNEAFSWIVDDLTSFNVAAMVATPVGASGRDAREHHHAMQIALTEIVSTLTAYKQAGVEQLTIIEAMSHSDPAEED